MQAHAILTAATRPAAALMWRTDDALQALAGDMASRLAPWAADWGLTLSVRCVNAWQDEAIALNDDAGWQAYLQTDGAEPLVWVRPDAEPNVAAAVLHAVFGRHVAAAIEATETVAAEATDLALRALRTGFANALEEQRTTAANRATLRAAHSATLSDAGALPRHEIRRWSGALRMLIDLRGIGTAQLKFHVSAQVLPRSTSAATTRDTQRIALIAVNDAMADSPVSVHAMLQQTPMSLGDLLALQPGDVIVTSHALAEPLQLVRLTDDTSVPATPLCAAALGMQGTARAVALQPRADI